MPRDDRWSALARAALRHDVYAALKAITSAVLNETDGRARRAQERIAQWEQLHAARVERATATLRDALGREQVDLATLSVALRVMRSLRRLSQPLTIALDRERGPDRGASSVSSTPQRGRERLDQRQAPAGGVARGRVAHPRAGSRRRRR